MIKCFFIISIFLCTFGHPCISSLAGDTPTALNSQNWEGTDGAHYWLIRDPGTYYLDVNDLGNIFVTSHNFAIWLNTSGITLDGNGITISGPAVPSVPSETGPNVYGIRANAGIPSEAILVTNLKVENKYYGIIFESVTNGRIEYVTATDNNFGIYLWKVNSNTLFQNTSNGNLHSGIVFDADATENPNNIIDGNTANGNTEFGIHLWLKCPNSTITGNTTNINGNMGMSITYDPQNPNIDPPTYVSNHIITGNTSNNNGNNIQNGNGIFVNNSTSNKISGNFLNGNTNVGLWLKSSDGNTVSNNETTGNGTAGAGIWLTTSTANSLTNNTCDDNLGHGIVLNSNSDSNTLIGNTASGNAQVGIVMQSHSNSNSVTQHTANNNGIGINIIDSIGNLISNNTVNQNQSNGILLESSADTNTISDNQITGNRTNGVWIKSSRENIFANNSCDNNSGHGIILNSSANDNELTGNSTNGNSQIGVMLQAQADFNIIKNHTANNNSSGIRILNSNSTTVINSTLNKNLNNGLWAESSVQTSITNNNITGSQNAGIYLKFSSNNTISGNNITDHAQWGILLNESTEQQIYNNNFNNPTGNAGFIGTCSNNTWNLQKTLGNNIVGGPYLGGNFWGKPDGTGYSQENADIDEDGLCDIAYLLSEDNTDEMPLHIYSSVTVSYVDPNDITCHDRSPCYTSIQNAISAATSGMTIKIVQGSYTESIVLGENKSITLEGGWDTTFAIQTPVSTSITPPVVSQGAITLLELRLAP